MMHLDDSESTLLKTWIIKKLEDISDADSDVLADYVLALLKTDEPEDSAKVSCIDNLRDFLLDSTESFVDAVFNAVATKAYDPSRPPPPKSSLPSFQPSTAALSQPARQSSESRKRGYRDWDREDHQAGRIKTFEGGERPIKQPRRGGRGGFDPRHIRNPQSNAQQNAANYFGQPLDLAAISSAMPPFDPNDPQSIAAFMALQHAMGMMPGIQGFPNAAPPYNQPNPQAVQRCRDYDTMGYCARGASCPYEHGNDPLVVPQMNDEYDPNQATLLNVQPNRTGLVSAGSTERGRGGQKRRGRGGHKRPDRADISHQGPNHNKSSTTVVVEQIPEDKLDEQTVRDFFSDFGTIEEVTLQPHKRLATIKYDHHEAAKSAYESPRVVFDNRFVKVYWHKSGAQANPADVQSARRSQRGFDHEVEMQDAEPEVDPEEIAKRQEEAQRRHDEARKKREEAEKQKQELDVKLKAMDAERQKMADLLAKKTGKSDSNASPSAAANGDDASEQTKALRAQLAKLEAEAKTLGIDPDTPHPNGTSGSFRGRGGYRGRPRGYGYGYRGGWHRGDAAGRGGAVLRLDNRPKTVAVGLLDGTYQDHEETLRNYLLFNSAAGESASVIQHPTRNDAALVTFPERYLSENFMAAALAPDFPLAEKVEVSWHQDAVPNGTQDTAATAAAVEPVLDSKAEPATNPEHPRPTDRDAFDVADDDDDRWG